MQHKSSGRPSPHHPDPQQAPDPDQGDLFAPEPDVDELTVAFLAFSGANPQVWNTLVKLAREWKAAGKVRCGIALLYNTVRWQLSMEIAGDGAFELNDHYQAYYARALMHFHPELAGMFEIRRAEQADRWIAQYRDGVAA